MSTSFPPPPPPPGPGEQPASGGPVPPPPSSDPYAAPPQGFPPAPQGYPAQGYGTMPGQVPVTPAGPVTRPQAMERAVLLMRVGAGLSLLSLILTFASKSAFRDAVEKASAKQPTPMTPDQVNATVGVAMVAGIVFGLLGVGLWLWMASANGKGKSWARIVATVFFGISVLGFFASFAQAGSVPTRILTLISLAVGVGAIVLMYTKESSAFYKASSAPRY